MSTPITEALVSEINRLLVRLDVRGVSANEIVACIKPLIADSEARAVAQWSGGLDQSLPDLYEAAKAERDRLRAEIARLDSEKPWLKEANATCDQLRADRAEASLHALRLVCGTTDAEKFSTWVDRANDRAEKAEAELKRYTDAVDAQPWATDEPIRVLLDRITIRLAAAETQLSTNHERAENIIKSREERIDSLGQEVTERRRDAQKSAALVGRLRRALADAISTYDPNRKETLVTAERQEAWIAALQEDAK